MDPRLLARHRERLAQVLIEKSYKEGDFTLASGRKSDYYFDCRVTALDPEGSWLIGNLFYELLVNTQVTGVGGLTMGADPLVSAVVTLSWHNFNCKDPHSFRCFKGFLVRKDAKGHGTNQFVEGLANFHPGDKVAILEDVVTTGGSVLKACNRAKEAGLDVVLIAAILDREEGGKELLKEAGYELQSLFTRPQLVKLGRPESDF